MNVYDFDQTIYYPDSSYSFVMFCMRRYPRIVLGCLPGDATALYNIYTDKGGTQQLKESVFSFLRYIDNVDELVESFWRENRGRIGNWYLKQAREDDLIISASPDFLLRPIAKELGVELIATPMDKYSGLITGKNCHDEEKVRRFRELYPDGHVDEFYSDSLSDTPMALLAEKAFLVKRGELSPWPKK